MAGLIVAVAILHGVSLLTAALVYLAVISIALVFIDLDVQRLPDRIVLPALPVIAALLVADAGIGGEWGAIGRAAVGLLALGGFYGILWIAYPAGLGFGDVKAATLLGMIMGYLGWSHLAVGAITGPLLGGIVVAVGLASGRLGRKSRVPYGPALIGGAWLGVLAGPVIANAYIGWVA